MIRVRGQAIRPSRMNLYTPEGMAIMLKTRLVEETAGEVNPRKLTWKGRSRKAPDTPPMLVKKETAMATRGGQRGKTSTCETGKTKLDLLTRFVVTLKSTNQDRVVSKKKGLWYHARNTGLS